MVRWRQWKGQWWKITAVYTDGFRGTTGNEEIQENGELRTHYPVSQVFHYLVNFYE